MASPRPDKLTHPPRLLPSEILPHAVSSSPNALGPRYSTNMDLHGNAGVVVPTTGLTNLIMHTDSPSLVLQSATTLCKWTMSNPTTNTAMVAAARPLLASNRDEGMWHTSSGPSCQDWELHRRTITQLYQTEERTLKDVKAIMEARHGFSATALAPR